MTAALKTVSRSADLGPLHTETGFPVRTSQPCRSTNRNEFSAIVPCKPRLILTHGEDGLCQALAKEIQQQFKLLSKLPKMGEVIEL